MASAKPMTIEALIAFLEKGGKEVDALNQQYKEHVKKHGLNVTAPLIQERGEAPSVGSGDISGTVFLCHKN